MEYQEQANDFEGAKLLTALALATNIGSRAIVNDTSAVSKQKPDPNPTDNATRIKLEQAAESLAQTRNPDFSAKDNLRRSKVYPGNKDYPGAMYRHTKEHIPDLASDVVYGMRYNPYVDSSVYAHELGHMVSQNDPTGLKINQLKAALRSNPSLGRFLENQVGKMPEAVAPILKPYMSAPKLLAAGRLALPTAIAAAIPGDNDAAAVLAANLIVAAPELIDEAAASRNALEIMKNAGAPATPRQRMRLAGAWGSYLAKPLTAALIGNVAGNVIEDMG